MKNKKIDPFKDLILDSYEKELEVALEKEEFVNDQNLEETKKMFEEAVNNYKELQETKSITLRVKKEDLIRVKAKAKRSGIAYQTLIGLLLHQFVKGETDINL